MGIALDNHSRVYVTQTVRRKVYDLDIRAHRDRIPDDLSFRTVEDKRAFFHQMLSPQRSLQNTWLPDQNGDGSNDWRDLTAGSEIVHLIEDTDGDGTADRSTISAMPTMGAILNKHEIRDIVDYLSRLK